MAIFVPDLMNYSSVHYMRCLCVGVLIQLSLFVWNNGAGVRLTDAEFLCGYQHSDAVNLSCSAWLSTNFPQCVCVYHCLIMCYTKVRLSTKQGGFLSLSWVKWLKQLNGTHC